MEKDELPDEVVNSEVHHPKGKGELHDVFVYSEVMQVQVLVFAVQEDLHVQISSESPNFPCQSNPQSPLAILSIQP